MLKVFIIVPCYNQAQYLDQCLKSVMDQTHIHWECIIINDGSSDNTSIIAQEWTKKDSRFKYLYKENGGLSSARNAGLDKAVADYIQFLDADDLLEPNRFELLFNAAKETSLEKQILISSFKTLTSDLKRIDHPEYLKAEFFNLKEILYNWDIKFTIPIHCGLFPSFCFLSFRFDENLKAKEDWLMWLTIFSTIPPILFVNKGLVLYRENDSGLTRNLDLMQENLDLAIKKIKFLIPIDEYCSFLQVMISKKNQIIKKLEEQNTKYKNSLSYQLLKKIKKNKFGFFLLKYILKTIK